MKILYPLHATGFEKMTGNEMKEAKTTGEEMICSVLNLDNSYKSIFSDLSKRIVNDYVLNKA